VLRRARHTWKEIAALSGVSVRTVRRIAAEAHITTIHRARQAGYTGGKSGAVSTDILDFCARVLAIRSARHDR
jgi:predicted transcriptional regulator